MNIHNSTVGYILTALLTYIEVCFLAVAEQLSAQHGAVKMLYSRVRLLLDYLKAVKAGDPSVKQSVYHTTLLYIQCDAHGLSEALVFD